MYKYDGEGARSSSKQESNVSANNMACSWSKDEGRSSMRRSIASRTLQLVGVSRRLGAPTSNARDAAHLRVTSARAHNLAYIHIILSATMASVHDAQCTARRGAWSRESRGRGECECECEEGRRGRDYAFSFLACCCFWIRLRRRCSRMEVEKLKKPANAMICVAQRQGGKCGEEGVGWETS